MHIEECHMGISLFYPNLKLTKGCIFLVVFVENKVESQGKNYHGRFVVDNISCVRYISCKVGTNPTNHIALLTFSTHFSKFLF